jgi:NhaP-type Na+/H+ or K+/H+ antiporter
METRILPRTPEYPLRVRWPLATCGIAVASGAFCGLLKGLSLTSTGASAEEPVSSQIFQILESPTVLVTPGEVIFCSVLAGAAVGLALVSIPLMTLMILRFRRVLYAVRRHTQQRLNQEMATIVDQTRRGPVDRA